MSLRLNRLLLAILVSAATWFVPASAQELSSSAKPSPAKVGEAGDPDRLQFEGVQTFKSKQIRRALARKPGYLLAAHPQAEMGPFLKELQDMVLAGYLASGFPDARVAVRYDAATLSVHVKVTEGPRFKARKILLVGVKSVPEAEFVRWFTTPAESPKKDTTSDASSDRDQDIHSGLNTPGKAERPDDPMWVAGDPVDFTASWSTQALAQVEACLAEQGFFFPQAKVELRRARTSGTADLIITINSLGPPGVINQIKVTGQQRNSMNDIIQFLGLRTGMKITASRLVEARRKLRNCGRFWDFEITPEYSSRGDKVSSRDVNLQIEVKELEDVARLNEALTPVQQALVRMCEWLEQFPSRDEDMHVTVSGQAGMPFAVNLVVAPKRGLLLNSADLGEASPVSAGFLLAEDSVQFCTWASGNKLAAPRHGGGSFFVHLLRNRDGTTNRFNLSFGAGYSGAEEDAAKPTEKPLAKFDIQIARAAFLHILTYEGSACSLDGGQLILSNSAFTLRADATTGRLIEVDGITNQPTFNIRFNAHAWSQASQDFEHRAAPLTNSFVPGRGLTSFLVLAGTEVLRGMLTADLNSNVSPDQRTRALAALRKLLNPEILAPVDHFFEGDGTNTFSIPMDQALGEDSTTAYLAALVFQQSDDLFPKQSWPWTIAREAVFVVMKQGRYTEVELARLYDSEDTGPIGCLTIAHLLAAVDSASAKDFALQGLARIGEREFLRDCNLILRGESGLARGFNNIAAVLRTLSDDELAALVTLLPEAEAELLRESATALRAQPDAALDSALSPALSRYWRQSLRAEVRSALYRLSRPKNAE